MLPRPVAVAFLIDPHCSCDVLVRSVGQSITGTLVGDFYAAHAAGTAHQAAVTGAIVARTCRRLHEELPAASAWTFIQSQITLCQNALRLAHDRADERTGH